MCGIAGIVSPDIQRYSGKVKGMVAALRHRGPDDDGVCFFPSCGLGHSRLSIVDLSTGHQPMFSSDKLTAVVFNGEIYGYHTIRDSLRDYPFQTNSDTEIILALYQQHGRRCLDHLPGMFAFAIWNERNRTLFAARDRFGEKPFYYAFGRGGELLFGSEIKAILASGLVEPVVDPESVGHYMKYLYVHPDKTIYKNIHTLPPAHCLVYSDGRLTIERYWRFPKATHHIGLPDAVERFRHLFSAAVQKQLVADVPVGAFLSGGLDSSTVVAVASGYKSKLRTFSFGFEDAVSELPFANEIAQRYGTDHQELTAKSVDIAELLLLMRDVYDEPFADSSNIPTYLISKLAREHLKVVLTGDGGDELLGGYGWWYLPLHFMAEAGMARKLELWLVQLIVRVLERARYRKAMAWRWRAAGMEASRRFASVIEAHEARPTYFSDAELNDLFVGGYSPDTRPRTYSWAPTNTASDGMMMDLENYMAGDILVKTDRASMANGLELRAPFLDVDFASFCISLPANLKICNGQDKYILREAYGAAWTKTIRGRGKQGFGAPVEQWLKRDSVKALKDSYLNDARRKVFSLLSFEKTRAIADGNDFRTWIMLVLALWLEVRMPAQGALA